MIFSQDDLEKIVTAAVTAAITTIAGLIKRRHEKRKLRQQGKLNDGK